MTFKAFLTSSLGKKFVMALTGISLVLFLIVHAGLNACIFLNDNGQTFNTVAHFMSHNWILRFLEIGLMAGIILHIIQGLMLVAENNKARPVKYYSSKPEKNSKWYSRSMGLLGTLILLFLIMHLAHFWVKTKDELYFNTDRHVDLYQEMRAVFSQWYVVVLYLVGLVALFFHLKHGFSSAFQSLGLNSRKYSPLLKGIGNVYTYIIIIAFALMPLSIYFGWLS